MKATTGQVGLLSSIPALLVVILLRQPVEIRRVSGVSNWDLLEVKVDMMNVKRRLGKIKPGKGNSRLPMDEP